MFLFSLTFIRLVVSECQKLQHIMKWMSKKLYPQKKRFYQQLPITSLTTEFKRSSYLLVFRPDVGDITIALSSISLAPRPNRFGFADTEGDARIAVLGEPGGGELQGEL